MKEPPLKVFPRTAGQFMDRIETCGRREHWRVRSTPAEANDEWSRTRIIFTLVGTEPFNAADESIPEAFVAAEHGTLIVSLDRGGYYFDLDQLYDHYPAWSWRQQLHEKGWATALHFDLLRELERLFPVSAYVPHEKQRRAAAAKQANGTPREGVQ
ncbi:hypothetical protein P0D88_46580 [Paraburkholderia sp. RL18-103-BIB-C]|uniref:hypothetical protein n=1 Tax=Paraburkholderia sp. RL18-103-BIB-C TaxID=3031637 RepID=UPI0038B77D14